MPPEERQSEHATGRGAQWVRASASASTRFKSQLDHFLAVLPGASYLSLLGPSFIHKVHLPEFP